MKSKKLISLLCAAALTTSAFAGLGVSAGAEGIAAAEVTLNEASAVTVLKGDGKVTVKAAADIAEGGVLIHAKYTSDGLLESVETYQLASIPAAGVVQALKYTIEDNDGFYVWDSLQGMKVYDVTVTDEPAPEPTPTATTEVTEPTPTTEVTEPTPTATTEVAEPTPTATPAQGITLVVDHTASSVWGSNAPAVTVDTALEHFNNDTDEAWTGLAFATFDLSDVKTLVDTATLTFSVKGVDRNPYDFSIFYLTQDVDITTGLTHTAADRFVGSKVKIGTDNAPKSASKVCTLDVAAAINARLAAGAKQITFAFTESAGSADLYGKGSTDETYAAPSINYTASNNPIPTVAPTADPATVLKDVKFEGIPKVNGTLTAVVDPETAKGQVKYTWTYGDNNTAITPDAADPSKITIPAAAQGQKIKVVVEPAEGSTFTGKIEKVTDAAVAGGDSSATIGIASGLTAEQFFGQPSSALGQFTYANVTSDKYVGEITGTAKYVSGYTGWSNVTADQEGNYIPVRVTLPTKDGLDYTKAVVKYASNVTESAPKTATGFTADDKVLDISFRMQDSGLEYFYFYVDLDGDGSAYAPVEYKVDVTKVLREHKITAVKSAGGTVEASTGFSVADKTITLTVIPDDKKALVDGSIKVNGGAIEVTKVNDTTYTFVMPNTNVTITETFKTVLTAENTITITGDTDALKVGDTLKATVAGISAADKVKYEWSYKGDGDTDVIIPASNTTGDTITVPSGAVDKKITVKVTGDGETYAGTISKETTNAVKDNDFTVTGTVDAGVKSVTLKKSDEEIEGTIDGTTVTFAGVHAGTYDIVVVEKDEYKLPKYVDADDVAQSQITLTQAGTITGKFTALALQGYPVTITTNEKATIVVKDGETAVASGSNAVETHKVTVTAKVTNAETDALAENPVAVKAADGSVVDVTYSKTTTDGDVYEFEMPAQGVTVTVTTESLSTLAPASITAATKTGETTVLRGNKTLLVATVLDKNGKKTNQDDVTWTANVYTVKADGSLETIGGSGSNKNDPKAIEGASVAAGDPTTGATLTLPASIKDGTTIQVQFVSTAYPTLVKGTLNLVVNGYTENTVTLYRSDKVTALDGGVVENATVTLTETSTSLMDVESVVAEKKLTNTVAANGTFGVAVDPSVLYKATITTADGYVIYDGDYPVLTKDKNGKITAKEYSKIYVDAVTLDKTAIDAAKVAVEVTPANPFKGETVTVVPGTNDDYTVSNVAVKNSSNGDVEVIKTDDGKYTFTVPADGKATIVPEYNKKFIVKVNVDAGVKSVTLTSTGGYASTATIEKGAFVTTGDPAATTATFNNVVLKEGTTYAVTAEFEDDNVEDTSKAVNKTFASSVVLGANTTQEVTIASKPSIYTVTDFSNPKVASARLVDSASEAIQTGTKLDLSAPKEIAAGKYIIVTPAAKTGYSVSGVTVYKTNEAKDANKIVAATKINDTEYGFTMPYENAYVYVSYTADTHKFNITAETGGKVEVYNVKGSSGNFVLNNSKAVTQLGTDGMFAILVTPDTEYTYTADSLKVVNVSTKSDRTPTSPELDKSYNHGNAGNFNALSTSAEKIVVGEDIETTVDGDTVKYGGHPYKMPADDVDINVGFTRKTYTVTNATAEADKEANHGYITVTGMGEDGKAKSDDTITVAVTPSTGYVLKSLKVTVGDTDTVVSVDGTKILDSSSTDSKKVWSANSDGTYSFKPANYNSTAKKAIGTEVTVTAVFADATFTVAGTYDAGMVAPGKASDGKSWTPGLSLYPVNEQGKLLTAGAIAAAKVTKEGELSFPGAVYNTNYAIAKTGSVTNEETTVAQAVQTVIDSANYVFDLDNIKLANAILKVGEDEIPVINVKAADDFKDLKIATIKKSVLNMTSTPEDEAVQNYKNDILGPSYILKSVNAYYETTDEDNNPVLNVINTGDKVVSGTKVVFVAPEIPNYVPVAPKITIKDDASMYDTASKVKTLVDAADMTRKVIKPAVEADAEKGIEASDAVYAYTYEYTMPAHILNVSVAYARASAISFAVPASTDVVNGEKTAADFQAQLAFTQTTGSTDLALTKGKITPVTGLVNYNDDSYVVLKLAKENVPAKRSNITSNATEIIKAGDASFIAADVWTGTTANDLYFLVPANSKTFDITVDWDADGSYWLPTTYTITGFEELDKVNYNLDFEGVTAISDFGTAFTGTSRDAVSTFEAGSEPNTTTVWKTVSGDSYKRSKTVVTLNKQMDLDGSKSTKQLSFDIRMQPRAKNGNTTTTELEFVNSDDVVLFSIVSNGVSKSNINAFNVYTGGKVNNTIGEAKRIGTYGANAAARDTQAVTNGENAFTVSESKWYHVTVAVDGDDMTVSVYDLSNPSVIGTAVLNAAPTQTDTAEIKKDVVKLINYVNVGSGSGDSGESLMMVDNIQVKEPITPNFTLALDSTASDEGVTYADDMLVYGATSASKAVFAINDQENIYNHNITAGSTDETVATAAYNAEDDTIVVTAKKKGTAYVTVTASTKYGDTKSEKLFVVVDDVAKSNVTVKYVTEVTDELGDTSLVEIADADTTTFSQLYEGSVISADDVPAETTLYNADKTVRYTKSAINTVPYTVTAEDGEINVVYTAAKQITSTVVKYVADGTTEIQSIPVTLEDKYEGDLYEYSGYPDAITDSDGRVNYTLVAGQKVDGNKGNYYTTKIDSLTEENAAEGITVNYVTDEGVKYFFEAEDAIGGTEKTEGRYSNGKAAAGTKEATIFTAPADGKYKITAAFCTDNSKANTLNFYKNSVSDSNKIYSQTNQTTWNFIIGTGTATSDEIELKANDKIIVGAGNAHLLFDYVMFELVETTTLLP